MESIQPLTSNLPTLPSSENETNIYIIPPQAIAAIESQLAQHIEKKIAKYVWSDSLFDEKGQRKFGIYFVPGNVAQLKAEITTTIKILICSSNFFVGGQQSMEDPALLPSIIQLLERASKALRQSIFIEHRDTLIVRDGKTRRIRSNFEDSNELRVIPLDETVLHHYSYTTTITVLDTETGNSAVVSGTNEADELIMFRARAVLHTMRENDKMRGE